MSDNKKINPLFERKYNSVIERSFKTKIDVFLFNELKQTGILNKVEADRFLVFLITEDIAGLYEDSWQMTKEAKIDGLEIKDFDKGIESWNKENLALRKVLFDAYVNHFKIMFPMDEFILFYKENAEERKCSYCGITEAEILRLRENKLIKTKRNRGKQMEIDRINSNMEYGKENVVLACYYCNNAKTDEFSPEEFKPVGDEIRKIWNNRLSKINSL